MARIKTHGIPISILTSVALFFLLSSCGQTTSKKSIPAKLKMGRHVAMSLPISEITSHLNLTQDNSVAGDIRGIQAELQQSLVEIKSPDSRREAQLMTFNPDHQTKINVDLLVDHAIEVIENLKSVLLISSSELDKSPRITQLTPHLRSLIFQRMYLGTIPIRDAYIELIYFSEKDQLYSLRQVTNNSHGEIAVSGRMAPAVSLEDIIAEIPYNQVSLHNHRQVVYPEMLKPGEYQFVMASELSIKSEDTNQIYTVTVDNASKRILEAFTNKIHMSRPVSARVFKRSYKEGVVAPKPIPDLEITTAARKVTTNIDGIADLSGVSTGQVLLRGLRHTIINNTATTPLTVNAGINALSSNEYTLEASDDGSRTALNAYTSFVEINRFALQHLDIAKTPFFSYNLPAFINVNEPCNAFFSTTPQSEFGFVALGQATAQCANMALVNDVAYHEWGHGLDNALGSRNPTSGGITDGTFSEGIGDIISTYFTDSPDMAVGFFLANNNPIRSANNASRYPNLQNQVHIDGQIISGAFWDMRKNLITTHGKTKGSYLAGQLFFSHLLNTDSYLQSYQNVLLLDDDDGNPATRSPNFCAINSAFARHGLATAENCTDKPDAAPRDDSIVIASQKQDASGVTFMASTTRLETQTMVACLGSRVQCDKNSALPRVTLEREGMIGTTRLAFSVAMPLPAKEQDIITVFGKNAAGETISSRMFKFVAK